MWSCSEARTISGWRTIPRGSITERRTGAAALCRRCHPTALASAVMAYDTYLHEVVLFGGATLTREFDLTWTFAGGNWTNVTALLPQSPPPTAGGMAAFDGASHNLLLFGGASGTAVSNDTWDLRVTVRGFPGAQPPRRTAGSSRRARRRMPRPNVRPDSRQPRSPACCRGRVPRGGRKRSADRRAAGVALSGINDQGATVGFATFAGLPEGSPDDLLAVEELANRSITVVPVIWGRPLPTDLSFDLVVIRSTWDYYLHRDDFLEWVDQTSRVAPVWNPPDVIRWNSHKGYLLDLQRKGCDVVPTEVIRRGDASSLDLVLTGRKWPEAVVKLTAMRRGGWRPGVLIVGPSNISEGERHLQKLLVSGRCPRPAVPRRVGDHSENGRSCFFNGEFAYAMAYASVLAERPRRVRPVVPDQRQMNSARAVIDSLPRTPLYARLDFLPLDGGQWLLRPELRADQAELLLPGEPSAFGQSSPGRRDRFVPEGPLTGREMRRWEVMMEPPGEPFRRDSVRLIRKGRSGTRESRPGWSPPVGRLPTAGGDGEHDGGEANEDERERGDEVQRLARWSAGSLVVPVALLLLIAPAALGSHVVVMTAPYAGVTVGSANSWSVAGCGHATVVAMEALHGSTPEHRWWFQRAELTLLRAPVRSGPPRIHQQFVHRERAVDPQSQERHRGCRGPGEGLGLGKARSRQLYHL